MHWVLLAGFILLLTYGPTLWVKGVMRWHSADRPDFPGTVAGPNYGRVDTYARVGAHERAMMMCDPKP